MLNWLIDIGNVLISGLGAVLSVIISILPKSPFSLLDNTPVQPFLSGLNWIIPVDTMISIGTTWLTAIGIYYAYQIVLRWIKAVGQ